MSEQKDGAALVKTIVGEIAAMEYAGDVQAIAAVIIDRDGDVRALNAFSQGAKLPIIAAIAVLQRQVLDQVVPIEKNRD